MGIHLKGSLLLAEGKAVLMLAQWGLPEGAVRGRGPRRSSSASTLQPFSTPRMQSPSTASGAVTGLRAPSSLSASVLLGAQFPSLRCG